VANLFALSPRPTPFAIPTSFSYVRCVSVTSAHSASSAQSSAFDAHHPPSPEILDKCVHCGFCLATCPTYVLWHEEMDSPRGRIHLIKTAAEGATQITPTWVQHFDTCLGCMACMTACPSGVDYGKLLESTRAQIERLHPRSTFEKLHRAAIFALFPYPRRLRLLRWPMLAYQKSGLQTLVRKSGILQLLPKKLRAVETLMPSLGRPESIAEVTPAHGEKRLRVGLLLGCVQREFLPQVNAATIRVLAAEGCEVVAPKDQPCCGALMVHAGEERDALILARRTIDSFERTHVDVIVTNAAGCGSNVREYGHLLRDDPSYATRAQTFSAKCKDITEVLAELPPRAKRNPVRARVAFHDSCHLNHAQGINSQPRQLLAAIPGLELAEIPESAICCGSAGIYNLVQPDAAAALGNRKAQLIFPLQPDVVATGNPGCLLQLQSALARQGHPTPVLHTIQLLDASISNKSVPEGRPFSG
jgi:glycolate oxidase iron-sulfur subunit